MLREQQHKLVAGTLFAIQRELEEADSAIAGRDVSRMRQAYQRLVDATGEAGWHFDHW
jgi:hypothetical protein